MTILAGGLQRLWGTRKNRARTVESENTNSSATTGGSVSQEPVVVWQAANPMEAQIVKGRLQSAGIPAIVRGESMGRIYGFVYGGLAERDVLVPGPSGRIRPGGTVRGDPVGLGRRGKYVAQFPAHWVPRL